MHTRGAGTCQIPKGLVSSIFPTLGAVVVDFQWDVPSSAKGVGRVACEVWTEMEGSHL